MTPANEWHPNFRIEDVELPERALPIHPDFEKPEGEKKKDNSFLNAHLDYFIKHREQEEKKKEFTAAMVSEMMVQNASSKEISHKLMEAVRNKEKRLKEQLEITLKESKKIEKEVFTTIINMIYMIYASKKVSYMFR